MRIYIATRFGEKLKVKQLSSTLKKHGHTVSYDWTFHKDATPFSKNATLSRVYAQNDIEGIKTSDIFIMLLSHTPGTGSSTELGAAIMSFLLTGKPEIYVVGDRIDQNMFFFHPVVRRYATLVEILSELGKKII